MALVGRVSSKHILEALTCWPMLSPTLGILWEHGVMDVTKVGVALILYFILLWSVLCSFLRNVGNCNCNCIYSVSSGANRAIQSSIRIKGNLLTKKREKKEDCVSVKVVEVE